MSQRWWGYRWVMLWATLPVPLLGCSSEGVVPGPPEPPGPEPTGCAPAGPSSFPGTLTGIDSELTIAARRPPPLGGGGLLVTQDDTRAIVSDPDRDRIYVVALGSRPPLELQAEVVLDAGSEPGRLVEDGAGRVHVVLRGSGELLSLDVGTSAEVARRAVCDEPRGLAYDPGTDVVHVACAEGRLVTLPAAGGEATRVVRLDDDLRDVVLAGDGLLVSRFRSAELLWLDASGAVVRRQAPPPIYEPTVRKCTLATRGFEPSVAYKLVPASDGTALVLHQRSETTPIDLSEPGPYSGGGSCLGIVHAVVSKASPDQDLSSAPALGQASLATDLALSPDGKFMAVTSSSTASGQRGVVLLDNDHVAATPAESCADGAALFVGNEATHVAFTQDNRLVVFSRQPAALFMYATINDVPLVGELPLSTISVHDTGHGLFNMNTGQGLACASCHPEAGDDGQVWTFDGFGPRRSQHLRGGILGTEPFHWEGDLPTFSHLINEVMVRRMGGPALTEEYRNALGSWIDAQPALTRTDFDVAARDRGQALFESAELRCAACHHGERLTNNERADVGTGLTLQVPTLVGVSFRAPFLHDGCAPTLLDRFGPCGGGDAHGQTSQLSPSELSDLVEYLKSL